MLVQINFLQKEMYFITDVNKKVKLEKNFTLEELANNVSNKNMPQYEINVYSILFCKCLQELRDKVNKPITINSGFRQADYNRSIGGDPNSAHLHAWAADIQKISGYDDETIAVYWKNICTKNGQIGAINLYDNYIHIEIMSDYCYGNKNFEIRDKRTAKTGVKKKW